MSLFFLYFRMIPYIKGIIYLFHLRSPELRPRPPQLRQSTKPSPKFRRRKLKLPLALLLLLRPWKGPCLGLVNQSSCFLSLVLFWLLFSVRGRYAQKNHPQAPHQERVTKNHQYGHRGIDEKSETYSRIGPHFVNLQSYWTVEGLMVVSGFRVEDFCE